MNILWVLAIPFGALVLLLIVSHIQEMNYHRDMFALQRLYTDLMFKALEEPIDKSEKKE